MVYLFLERLLARLLVFSNAIFVFLPYDSYECVDILDDIHGPFQFSSEIPRACFANMHIQDMIAHTSIAQTDA